MFIFGLGGNCQEESVRKPTYHGSRMDAEHYFLLMIRPRALAPISILSVSLKIGANERKQNKQKNSQTQQIKKMIE